MGWGWFLLRGCIRGHKRQLHALPGWHGDVDRPRGEVLTTLLQRFDGFADLVALYTHQVEDLEHVEALAVC